MARGLKFQEVEGLYFLGSENKKVLISCTVIAQLICVFIFTYVKSRFSHDAAQFMEKTNKAIKHLENNYTTSTNFITIIVILEAI